MRISRRARRSCGVSDSDVIEVIRSVPPTLGERKRVRPRVVADPVTELLLLQAPTVLRRGNGVGAWRNWETQWHWTPPAHSRHGSSSLPAPTQLVSVVGGC